MAKKGIPGQSAATIRQQRTEAYAQTVKKMFDETVNDILKLKLTLPKTEDGIMYSFDGDTQQIQKKVADLLKRLNASATLAIKKGIQAEWETANKECDDLIKQSFGQHLLESDKFRAWTSHNENAMNAFINRSDNGMKLSDRVWKSAQQFRDQMEVALTVGMGSGTSAASMSRTVRQCLNDPDLMFRRFKYKKGEEKIFDENGKQIGTKPIYGRKWKKKIKDENGKTKWIDYDKNSYTPNGAGSNSRGVYRSAYKNAMRVTRTETNMAYRRADYERWQKLSFIRGIRIELSNQHPDMDICDAMQGDYPKNFYFSGWHPHCFCYAVPILVSEDEMKKVSDEFVQGRTYYPKAEPIMDTPQNFKDWISDNQERIKNSNSQPYWIKDNPSFVDAKKGIALTPDEDEIMAMFPTKPEKPVRTEAEREAIINARQAELEQFAKDEQYSNDIIAKANDYDQDIDLTRIKDLLSRNQYTRAAEEAKAIEQAIAQIKTDEAALKDLIPNVDKLHKQYSMEQLQQSYTEIKTTFEHLKTISLTDQKNLLETLINNGSNQLLKDTYGKKLNDVKIDIHIEQMKPEMAKFKLLAANSSSSIYKAFVSNAERYLNQRIDFAAQEMLDKLNKWQPLVDRYESLMDYYKTTPAGMGKAKTDSKVGVCLKKAEKLFFNKDSKAFDDALKEIELAEKTKAINEASNARKKAAAANKKNAKATAAATPPQKKISEANYDELEAILGPDMPRLIKGYRDSVKRMQFTDSELIADAAEIERKLKEMFEKASFAHMEHSNLLDTQILDGGIMTNLQVNDVVGHSVKGKSYDDGRRYYGHFAYNVPGYNPKRGGNGYLDDPKYNLRSGEYYRCGSPTYPDIQKGWDRRRGTGYGDAQVIFRKDRVISTFTWGNSLSEDTIPSLTTDPKICSLDKMVSKTAKRILKKSKYDLDELQDQCGYIEIQYIPIKGDKILPRDIEKIILEKFPEKIHPKAVWDRWYEAGVDIYYEGPKGVELYRKGKPIMTQEEARAQLDTMQDTIDNWVKNMSTLENKDISFAELQKQLKGTDYISTLDEVEKMKKSISEMEKREKALEALIPDVKDWHKQFSMDELELAHTAIQKQFNWLENKYDKRGDVNEVIGKLGRIISDNEKKKKYVTWPVSNAAYARRRDELVYQLKKDSIDDTLQRLRDFKTKDKTFLKKLKAVEDKVATKSWYDADKLIEEANNEMLKLSTGGLQKALKLGESSRILFDSDAFSEAKKKAAQWFRATGKKPTAAAMRKAYKEADAYMSQYAEEMWSKLTVEEKKALWLYTDGSQYINQEMLGMYQNHLMSPWGDFHDGFHDANVITSIIEKAPALKDSIWMQSGKDHSAFDAIFGVDIQNISDLSTLVGREGTNSVFTSCHSASHGHFTKKGNATGFRENDVVMTVFLPEGTKGAYMEPFASWGDSKRGYEGYKWDGKRQKCAPSDQVEFVLQRGSKFKITKAEYNHEEGKWYIDVDLIEQPSVKALQERDDSYYKHRNYRAPNYIAPKGD